MNDKPLPGNPYAAYAQTHMDPALALLALAHEIRTLNMIQHPYFDHNMTNERMRDNG